MKLILAQGNPGHKYSNSRHNAGWQVVDALALEQGMSFQDKPKFYAELAEFSHGNEKVLIAKPTTFYNDTGLSARALMDFYKLGLDDILVIHDDIVLDFGKIRVRRGGENAGNNGLKSLHRHIGENFWHIRIGADSLLRRKIGDLDFVLGNFNADEQKILQDWIIPEVIKLTEKFLDGAIEPLSVRL